MVCSTGHWNPTYAASLRRLILRGYNNYNWSSTSSNFNSQERAISTLNCKSLKFVDQLTYLLSNISSTESDFNICIAKAGTATERLPIIWKFHLIKMGFLPKCGHVSTTLCMHYLNSNKTHGEKTRWELHKNVMYCFEQILEAAPHKTAAVQPLTSSHNKQVEQDMLFIPGKVRANS